MARMGGGSWRAFLGKQALHMGAGPGTRRIVLPVLIRAARRYMVDKGDDAELGPVHEREDKLALAVNVLRATLQAYDRGSPAVKQSLSNLFLRKYLLPPEERAGRKQFIEAHGMIPPLFLTISPGGACNLACRDCYAASTKKLAALPAEALEWVLDQKQRLWGSWFTVVSGGEPFLWRDGEVDLIEIARRHPDHYFLVYSNGTLIDENLARRLGEIGNMTVAISVEGFEDHTDARRGKGVHRRILEAFGHLREAGVPFGISLTANRDNENVALSDELIDFYFDREGALYLWLFHYMPIGRGVDVGRQVSPETRAKWWWREQELIHERHLFLVDFWNLGTVSSGCIAGGRGGGYLYIDWNGNVYPCVFVPYWKDNILELMERGKTLNDAIFSDFFEGYRLWQKSYSYKKAPPGRGNEIRPCPIRDHYQVTHRIVRECGAHPGYPSAARSLEDPDFLRAMLEYDEEVARHLDPIWSEHYIGTPPTEPRTSGGSARRPGGP